MPKLKKIKCDFFVDFETLCAILTNNGKTVLPDRSLLIRQKLVGNAKVGTRKCDFLKDFQTLC